MKITFGKNVLFRNIPTRLLRRTELEADWVGGGGVGGAGCGGTAPGRSRNAHTVSDDTPQGRLCHPKLTRKAQLLQTEPTRGTRASFKTLAGISRCESRENVTPADPETLAPGNAAV